MSVTIVEESRGFSEAFGFRGVKLRVALVAETNPVVDISPISKILTFHAHPSNSATPGASFNPESAPTITLAFGAPVTDTIFIDCTGI